MISLRRRSASTCIIRINLRKVLDFDLPGNIWQNGLEKRFMRSKEETMAKKALSWLALVAFLFGGEAEAFGKGKKTSRGSKSVRAAVLPVETKGLPKQLRKTIYNSAFQELLAIGLFRMLPEKKLSIKLRKLRRKRLIGPKCMAKEKCVRMLGRKPKSKTSKLRKRTALRQLPRASTHRVA